MSDSTGWYRATAVEVDMRRSLLAVMAGDPDTTASAPAGGSGRQWPRGRLACTNDEMPLYGRLTTSSTANQARVVKRGDEGHPTYVDYEQSIRRAHGGGLPARLDR